MPARSRPGVALFLLCKSYDGLLNVSGENGRVHIAASRLRSSPLSALRESDAMGDATPIQAVYVVIGALALLPIYFGSFASLKVPNPPRLTPQHNQLEG